MSKTIRILTDLENPASKILDWRTRDYIFFHRGDDVTFEIGAAKAGAMLIGLSGTIYLEIKSKADPDLVPYLTASTTAINSSLTLSQWRAGDGQTASIIVPGAQTGVIPPGTHRLIIWLDTSSSQVTLYSGEILVRETGSGNPTAQDWEPDAFERRSGRGSPNGYASLDAGGRVPNSQLRFSAYRPMGAWNADTGLPAIGGLTKTAGSYWVVSVGGTSSITDTEETFDAGDWVLWDGSAFIRIPRSQADDITTTDGSSVEDALRTRVYKFNTTAEVVEVAAMASAIPTGAMIQTAGRDTAGDGGGGTFIIEATGTPNGGTVIALADGRYARMPNWNGDVRVFGAKGDGVTDDTSAIQAALSYAAPAGIGLRFPEGRFIVGTPLSYSTVSKRLHVKGQGQRNTIIEWTGGAGSMLTVDVLGLQLEDLSWLGTKDNANPCYTANAFGITALGNVNATNVYFHGWDRAFNWAGGYYHKFTKCTFTRCNIAWYGGSAYNLTFDQCWSHRINRVVQYNGGSGPILYTGGSIESIADMGFAGVSGASAPVSIVGTYIENYPENEVEPGLKGTHYNAAFLVYNASSVTILGGTIYTKGWRRIIYDAGGVLKRATSVGNSLYFPTSSDSNDLKTLQYYLWTSAKASVVLEDSVRVGEMGGGDFDAYSSLGNINKNSSRVINPVTGESYFNTRVIEWRSSPPTSGAWQQGDIVLNSAATSSQPFGWRCVQSGSPGLWITMWIGNRTYNGSASVNLASIDPGAHAFFDIPVSKPGVDETITGKTAVDNALPVAENTYKWITGMPVSVSDVSGFDGPGDKAPPEAVRWIIRVDAETIKLAPTLSHALNWDPEDEDKADNEVEIIGTGSLKLTAVGAYIGDYASVYPDIDTEGLIFYGWVDKPDNVRVSVFNPTSGAIDLDIATYRARVEKRHGTIQ